jgi:hypothetical protein
MADVLKCQNKYIFFVKRKDRRVKIYVVDTSSIHIGITNGRPINPIKGQVIYSQTMHNIGNAVISGSN